MVVKVVAIATDRRHARRGFSRRGKASSWPDRPCKESPAGSRHIDVKGRGAVAFDDLCRLSGRCGVRPLRGRAPGVRRSRRAVASAAGSLRSLQPNEKRPPPPPVPHRAAQWIVVDHQRSKGRASSRMPLIAAASIAPPVRSRGSSRGGRWVAELHHQGGVAAVQISRLRDRGHWILRGAGVGRTKDSTALYGVTIHRTTRHAVACHRGAEICGGSHNGMHVS